MLDIMRKHTGSWLVKVVFGLIILSFILFFGYSQMDRDGAGKNTAATVNGKPIPMGFYKMAFENTREFYKKLFPDDIPEEMAVQMRQAALHQVINQSLLIQLASEFKIEVTPVELFEFVSKNPNFQKNGSFDSESYKNVFLPYFQRRYGMNYEDFVKDELLADKVRKFLEEHIIVTETDARYQYDRENRKWTFERIEVPVTAPEGVEYDLSGEEIAQKIIQLKNDKNNNALDKHLTKYKLEGEQLEDVTLEKKHRLLNSPENEEVIVELLTMKGKNSTYNKPVKSGTSWIVFTLIGTTISDEKKWEKDKESFVSSLTQQRKQEYLMQWIDSMKEKADIREYVLGMR